mmetsp:Transcript_105173/g.234709  ORF Transcript_105173/g.234709 Transcript_105173/m.234709 type:complete len:312 (+) Transcript_105173:135-1070(+)
MRLRSSQGMCAWTCVHTHPRTPTPAHPRTPAPAHSRTRVRACCGIHCHAWSCSLPPGHLPGAEVLLRPRGHGEVSISNRGVRQRQRQGGGAADFLAVGVVLRAVARADEPVCGLHPRHNAAQVGADRIDPEVLDLVATFGSDNVGGLALKALHQLTLFRFVGLQPIFELDRITIDVATGCRAPASSGDLREEVESVAAKHHQHGHRCDRYSHHVHEHAPLHVRHEACVLSSCGHLHDAGPLCTGRSGAPRGRHKRAGDEVGANHKREGSQRKAATALATSLRAMVAMAAHRGHIGASRGPAPPNHGSSFTA